MARTKILLAMTLGMAAAAAVTIGVAATRGEPPCSDGCGPTAVVVPAGAEFGAKQPAVLVALFVDLESSASRQVFAQATRSIDGLGLEVAVALRVLQLPRTPCTRGSNEVGCVGARAVECAELLAGVGVRAAGAVFDMQWTAPSQRTSATVLTAVARVGVEAEALARCVASEDEVERRLAGHAAMAARHGLRAAPGGVVVMTAEPTRSAGFGAWLTERTLRDVVRCLAQRRCEVTS